eukprot:30430-Amphidinium_carterae.1
MAPTNAPWQQPVESDARSEVELFKAIMMRGMQAKNSSHARARQQQASRGYSSEDDGTSLHTNQAQPQYLSLLQGDIAASCWKLCRRMAKVLGALDHDRSIVSHLSARLG